MWAKRVIAPLRSPPTMASRHLLDRRQSCSRQLQTNPYRLRQDKLRNYQGPQAVSKQECCTAELLRSHPSKKQFQIAVILSPRMDVAALTRRPTVASKIKSHHSDFMVEHLIDYIAVAATVLSQPMYDAQNGRSRTVREP